MQHRYDISKFYIYSFSLKEIIKWCIFNMYKNIHLYILVFQEKFDKFFDLISCWVIRIKQLENIEIFLFI